ncbi:MAG: ComEC/Rec2 family competence protein [Candidatus Paceibacterota bacterium]
MQGKIFYVSCFGFVLGVLLRSFVFVNLFSVVFIGIVSFALLVFFVFISKNKFGILVSIFVLLFSLGIFRFSIVDVSLDNIFFAQDGPALGWESNKIKLSGIVVDEPSIGVNNQKLIVKVLGGKDKTQILISTNLDQEFKYGDEINFEGILKKPENFVTDQGKEFDYVNYLRKDGVFYVMTYPKIEVLSSGNGNLVKSSLFYIKEKFLEKMNLVIREPESLLMSGLILGEKSAFDASLRKSFVDTGTIHIVALSGYNVTIVAEWIMKLFSSFPKNIGIGAGIFSILLFIIMTGGSSTAVRAGIMATLALTARLIGRNYDVSRALMLAGVSMILINPFILRYDVSFQLSFIATVAVIFYTPRIEKYFLWATSRFGLRDIVSVTCACYIFVLPFILYKMGNLSLVALPANILILPFIPFTMILGFLTGFTGIIWYMLSVPFGYISYLFLHYELSIISFFANISFASLTIPNFPLILTILIYMYFIYFLFWKSIKGFFIEPF